MDIIKIKITNCEHCPNTYVIDVNIGDKQSFNIRKNKYSIGVLRMVNGKTHVLQRMHKTYFEWHEVAEGYKKLRPIIPRIINRLIDFVANQVREKRINKQESGERTPRPHSAPTSVPGFAISSPQTILNSNQKPN